MYEIGFNKQFKEYIMMIFHIKLQNVDPYFWYRNYLYISYVIYGNKTCRYCISYVLELEEAIELVVWNNLMINTSSYVIECIIDCVCIAEDFEEHLIVHSSRLQYPKCNRKSNRWAKMSMTTTFRTKIMSVSQCNDNVNFQIIGNHYQSHYSQFDQIELPKKFRHSLNDSDSKNVSLDYPFICPMSVISAFKRLYSGIHYHLR